MIRRALHTMSLVLALAPVPVPPVLADYKEGQRAWDAGRPAAALPPPGTRFRDCAECPEMMVVPAGSYTMGSPPGEEWRDENESPQHRVTIAEPFAVEVYEVTRGEFARFVSATGHSMGNSCWIYEDGEWKDRAGYSWRSPGFRQTDRDPVVCVNWAEAKAYVRWLSSETGKEYRLLSESEWEYVARAGTTTSRYWGKSESGQCVHANGADKAAGRRYGDWKTAKCEDGHVRTSPVGSFSPNGFGLHDVPGNVWEWVEDCWNDGYAGAPDDGSAWLRGDCGLRVLRGGSWDSYPVLLRSAYRSWFVSSLRFDNVGFRLARTLTP